MNPHRFLISVRDRLRDQRGFTMAVTMGIMSVTSVLALVAFQTARGDIHGSGVDKDRKVAYAAAEAGINYYAYQLAQSNTYWTKCHTGPPPNATELNPVNQPWNGTSPAADPRRWRNVSGSKAKYTIEMIPQPPATQCLTASPDVSMINTASGTFKLRSTGKFNRAKRTLVATMRRVSFLDFLYFTDFETLDPVVYTDSRQTSCANKYRANRPSNCTNIVFITADNVKGPLHTNDDLLTCGSPTFGRNLQDAVHVSGPAPGYNNSGCGGGPNFVGAFKFAQPTMQMPPTNTLIRNQAVAPNTGLLLTGTQYIRFRGDGTMVVDTPAGNPVAMAVPANGVIYVQSGACGASESPLVAVYTDANGCANVYVSGTYNSSITIASEKDIIVAPTLATLSTTTSNQFNPTTAAGTDANLIGTNNALLGLIANNFVRVYHRDTNCDGNNSNVGNVSIDAAILSLQHSFIVDRYMCGNPLGSLRVFGAIAQKYRGPVGTTSGGVVQTGYSKDYNYDDRLRYREPPFFLNPVNARWRVLRQNEMVPAR